MVKQLIRTVAVGAASAIATAGVSRFLNRNNQHLLPMYRTLEQKLMLDGNTTGFYIIHNGPGQSTLYFKKDNLSPMKELGPSECQNIIEFLGEYMMQLKMAGSPEQMEAYKEHMEKVHGATGLTEPAGNDEEKPDMPNMSGAYL
jgi:hypothetical protein